MAIPLANEEEIHAFIEQYDQWSVLNGKLHREYVFKDFVQAFGFMTQAAFLAERANHHPEWFNIYKTVIVDLTTHEVHGITQRDFDLAQRMERIAGDM